MAGSLAVALICAFAAIFGAAAPAGAATVSFTLSSASLPGQSSVGWQVGLGDPPATPNVWADPITLSGQIDSGTGSISAATLSMPSITQPPTLGQTPTFTFSEVHPGTATGTFNSTTGAVTLTDTLRLAFNIEPINYTCDSSPINVNLSGTWDPGTENVTLATTSSFTIPQFPDAFSLPTCSGGASSQVLAGINANPGGVAGSVGNSMSLALHGQFSPGLPTTTTLAVNPSSPQLAGTGVTMTATVSDPSGVGTPTGTVDFLDNGSSIGGSTLSSGTATFTTTALPGGTNQLSVSYAGSATYAMSTSTSQAYVVEPLPALSANLPSSVTIGGAATPFTVTISNPASGETLNQVYLALFLASPLSQSTAANRPTFSYEDSAGNWCALPWASTSTKSPVLYFSGVGAPACGAAPASMALNAGSTIAVPMEVSYPATSNVGTQNVQVYLLTGSCTSSTSCTAVTPLNKNGTTSTAPTADWFQGTVNVLPVAGAGTGSTTITDTQSRPGTTTVRQGFNVNLAVTVAAQGYDAVPTGSVQFVAAGQNAGIGQLGTGSAGTLSAVTVVSPTFSAKFDTVNLAPGTYTLVATYSGDQNFAPNSLTENFTVVAGPPAGTLYTCNPGGLAGGTFSGYVTAIGQVPATAPANTNVTATGVKVTLDLDPAGAGVASVNNDQQPATIGFSLGGSTATAGPITFSGNAATATDVVGTWTGMSTSIPITGVPGTTVSIDVGSIQFGFENVDSINCIPTDQGPVVATVIASGNTLTVSPSDSPSEGTPITLTDAVYPAPPAQTVSGTWGQVDFYDGSTDLGTVPVVTSGHAAVQLPPNNGTAMLGVNSLAVGDHQLTAIWNGSGNVPSNTSNTVDYTVGTTTTTALVSSANPANAAKSVTFTATVTPPDGATTMPTGDVSFTSDGNPISGCSNQALSMVSMDSPPTATCTTSFGAGQSHAIVATYGGDATYLGSASDPLSQATLPGTNTTILSTKDPSPPGNVTFWAGVSPSSGTGATPTGTVAFTIDGSVYKPCNAQPLGSGGGASCTVSFKAGTTHKVFATYPGSASYSGSKSNTLTQTVTGAKGSTGPKATGGSATLASGKSLTAGQSISTGAYKLIMQSDGNLVEYQGTKALWASDTAGHSGTSVTMQKDGNLVEYQGGHAIWASTTAGHEGSHLTLQASDGNVVIYTPANNAIWATGT